jgi:hypothetical protein
MNTAIAQLGAPAVAVAVAALVSSAAVLGASEGCASVGVRKRSAPAARVAQRAVDPDRTDGTAGREAERRIALARARLGITPGQVPHWEAFAGALREQALVLDGLAEQSKAVVEPRRPHTNQRPFAINGHKADTAARAGSQKQFAAAWTALYDRLTDEQKVTAASLLIRHDDCWR